MRPRAAIARARSSLSVLPLVLGAVLASGCGDEDGTGVAVPDRPGAVKTAAVDRALRRSYDGAPPVTPHPTSGGFAGECANCHDAEGMAIEGLGFAPPSPHGLTPGMGVARCQQCHVEQRTEELFRATSFAGFPQDLRSGERQHEEAPPVMPHRLFMREQCAACHSGPAAREEIRTDHPERLNCLQCHAEQRSETVFTR